MACQAFCHAAGTPPGYTPTQGKNWSTNTRSSATGGTHRSTRGLIRIVKVCVSPSGGAADGAGAGCVVTPSGGGGGVCRPGPGGGSDLNDGGGAGGGAGGGSASLRTE